MNKPLTPLPREFRLSRPVVIDGRLAATLRIAELTLSGFRAIAEAHGLPARVRALVAQSCGISAAVVDALTPADVAAIGKIAAPHLEEFARFLRRSARGKRGQ